jgi:sterol desaturase/sphingolipid hydroxylase (fatty acid hydroxylase superfamily)
VEILELLKNEILGFFSVQGLIDLVHSGNYSSLRTWAGITTTLSPLIPFIVVIEMIMAFAHRKFSAAEYKIPFFIYVFNRIVGRYISLGVVAFCFGVFQPLALLHLPLTWYGFIFGYVVWEFSHFIYHYLAHKVRLFWCLHSTHHAPEQMNLSVTYAHFILEAPYADFIRTSICMLLGVEPVMLFAIMFIDGTWGGFIHVGENFMKDSRLGFLGKLILTPSHHRVHHARNPLYMDTNFCNLLNIWDRIFKTYQPEQNHIEIEYGITRTINSGNFWDVYFGEFYYLAKDIGRAPGIVNKFLYLVMPPGWSHTGEHKLASTIREEFIKKNSIT